MKLVTTEQMRAIDRRAIDELGIPGVELMENAGKGIAAFVRDTIFGGRVSGKRVAIFAGAGNNGGDGYVIARWLDSWGAVAHLFLLVDRAKIQGDALTNLERLKQTSVEISGADQLPDVEELGDYDLLVDAIFGTGFRGEVREPQGSTIERMNNSGVPILAVDTPSGVDVDARRVAGVAVTASYTATLALPKLGHFFHPIRGYCGQIEVIDIGIPDEAVAAEGILTTLVTPELVRKWIPARRLDSHKGDSGKLFIVAGSVGLTGAATLAAESAMRAGAGLVKVGIPESLNDILEAKLTEAMTRPLPELKKPRCLALRSLGVILEEMKSADALCIGPGLGRHHETRELVKRLLRKLDRPAVLDADGLFPFSGEPDELSNCRAQLVLTPHIGEFARLTGRSTDEIEGNRIELLREYAAAIGKTVLLKGSPTLIANADGEVYLSPTGNPGMATGGSGDVLSGVIAALLAYRVEPTSAAAAGAYLHGLAGDLAASESGIFGMIAGDICSCLPEAFLDILE